MRGQRSSGDRVRTTCPEKATGRSSPGTAWLGPEIASRHLTREEASRGRLPDWLRGRSEIDLSHERSLSGCVTKQLKGRRDTYSFPTYPVERTTLNGLRRRKDVSGSRTMNQYIACTRNSRAPTPPYLRNSGVMPRTRQVAFLALLLMILAQREKRRENDRESRMSREG